MKLRSPLEFPDGTTQSTTYVLPVAGAALGGIKAGGALSIDGATGVTTLADGIITKAKMALAMAAIQKGAANPASPTSGDTVFRSDKGRLLWYDGARWVTVECKELVLPPGENSVPLTVTGQLAGRGIKAGGYASWLVAWNLSTYVLGTNDASNYWRIQLNIKDAAGGTTTLATLDTTAQGPSNWARQQATAFSPNPVTTSAALVYELIGIKPTGAAGNLYVVSSLEYRDIIP